jgi:putative ABC transport system substrate-binding protein
MRRREFIAGLGAAAWPLAATAQQSPLPVIGFLSSDTPALYAGRLRAFRQGLAEAGYVEGKNVAIEYRWAGDRYDQFPALAADLIRRQVSVIVAGSTPGALAAKAATTTVPIVFAIAIDPVAARLVASLNRPGGNLTGISTLNVELMTKRLELLHEAIPMATDIAVLVNPANPAQVEAYSKDLLTAAGTLGLRLQVAHTSTDRDLDDVFATLLQARARALVIGIDPLFNAHMEKLAALALRYAVPAIYSYREFAATGGLMSYGTSLADFFRLTGIFAGRILKGEKPGDLPVQQVTKVELVINLKTAKALGLTIPPNLLVRADEVIE